MLLSNYIEFEFKVYACANGHEFAIRNVKEKNLRILAFSNLLYLYPDGTVDRADFEKMEIKHWKKTADRKKNERNNIKISTYCFICDEILTSFKILESHVQDPKHTENVNEFMKTLPEEMRKPTTVKKEAGGQKEEDNSGY
jgi:hypothetical protein